MYWLIFIFVAAIICLMVIFIYCHYYGYIKADCGHYTKKTDCFTLQGVKYYVYVSFNFGKFNRPKYCKTCIETYTIACSECGQPIMPGSIVTAYLPDRQNQVVIIKSKDLSNIICDRSGCLQPINKHLYYWLPPGKLVPIEQHRDPELINILNKLNIKKTV